MKDEGVREQCLSSHCPLCVLRSLEYPTHSLEARGEKLSFKINITSFRMMLWEKWRGEEKREKVVLEAEGTLKHHCFWCGSLDSG